jgi:thiamine-monophosphate kinase
MARRGGLDEFGLIARYFAPLATDTIALGLRDDAALLKVPDSQEVVLSTDTIVAGVHFLADDPPETIGHKALAVNLSDLAAKGARPYVYLLALSLPEMPSEEWLAAFTSGLRALQERVGICLVGGDTTRTPGPLSITATALGLVPQGRAVLRHGAQPGDRLYVSGTIGDAWLGLRLLQEPALGDRWGLSGEERAFLIDRYRRPAPRVGLARVVCHFALAAIDVSDGLVGDAQKLAEVSHRDIVIETEALPLSPGGRKAVEREPKLVETLIAAGDDYEILAAVPQASAADFEAESHARDVPVTAIGRIETGQGLVRVIGEGGAVLKLAHKGFSHF